VIAVRWASCDPRRLWLTLHDLQIALTLLPLLLLLLLLRGGGQTV
jgi:hypothetical protein